MRPVTVSDPSTGTLRGMEPRGFALEECTGMPTGTKHWMFPTICQSPMWRIWTRSALGVILFFRISSGEFSNFVNNHSGLLALLHSWRLFERALEAADPSDHGEARAGELYRPSGLHQRTHSLEDIPRLVGTLVGLARGREALDRPSPGRRPVVGSEKPDEACSTKRYLAGRGCGKERARVAYATLADENIRYTFDSTA